MHENSYDTLEAKRTSSESLNMSKVRAVVEGVTKTDFPSYIQKPNSSRLTKRADYRSVVGLTTTN